MTREEREQNAAIQVTNYDPEQGAFIQEMGADPDNLTLADICEEVDLETPCATTAPAYRHATETEAIYAEVIKLRQDVRALSAWMDAINGTLLQLNETSMTNKEYIAAEIGRFRAAVEASRCQASCSTVPR